MEATTRAASRAGVALEDGAVASLDPFALEIIKDKLGSTADEMGAVLARTSMSPIVYEVLDFACGLTDPTGQVVAQTNGLTLFTGTFRPQVESALERFGDELKPGDVYLTNDPYRGGTHICDVCLAAPIFVDGELVGFGVAIAHWIEIGGSMPGSIPPDATEIFQEGLLLPCVRIADADGLVADVANIITTNVRLPEVALGDLRAGIASLRIAERRVAETANRYGRGALAAAYHSLLGQGEARARAALRDIADGTYTAADVIDGDGVNDEPLSVQVVVTVEGDRLTADFTGTCRASGGPVNCSRGALESACKTAFRAITDPHGRSNEGCFRPFEVICPWDTVFTARAPKPTGWYYEATAFATELVWRALAPVLPERLGAGSYVSLCATYVVGETVDGDVFVLAEPNNGGWGGDRDRDGAAGLIATNDGDTYNFPVEVIESRFPLRVERYSFDVPDGGACGAGRRRGGHGLVREYRILDTASVIAYGSMGGSRRRPWGHAGGGEGSVNYIEYLVDGDRIRCGRMSRIDLAPGDLVCMVTGQGGGYGDPFEREPERVLTDVRDGLVTPEAAEQIYGVVLDAQARAVDQQATETRRRDGGRS